MPKSFNSVWIHFVFSTKNREPIITHDIRNAVCDWIRNEAVLKGRYVDSINGQQNHLHVLMKLDTTETVSEYIKWIKGSSSRWLNKNFNWEIKFEWQQGYGAFSVSRENIQKVRNYIYNQEIIHKKRSYTEEIRLLTRKYNPSFTKPRTLVLQTVKKSRDLNSSLGKGIARR